jgi:hypothetical protein
VLTFKFYFWFQYFIQNHGEYLLVSIECSITKMIIFAESWFCVMNNVYIFKVWLYLLNNMAFKYLRYSW